MAMGTAVIACDVAAVSEQIVDGDSGLIVPPGDADALAAAIIALARDAPRREGLAAAGHTRVRRFSIETMTEKTVIFWQSCLGKSLDGRRGRYPGDAVPSRGNDT
jgi:glycosyltransferase involved in cell wall biosynthesis